MSRKLINHNLRVILTEYLKCITDWKINLENVIRHINWNMYVTILTVPPPVLACWCAHGKYAQKLLNDLFTNYTSALRPVEDTNNILNVTLQITLSQIIDMVKQHMCKQVTTKIVCVKRICAETHAVAWDQWRHLYISSCPFTCNMSIEALKGKWEKFFLNGFL